MKHSEIIIIGSSFAGVSSALTVRQLYPNKRVLIIEKEGSSASGGHFSGGHAGRMRQPAGGREGLGKDGAESSAGCGDFHAGSSGGGGQRFF